MNSLCLSEPPTSHGGDSEVFWVSGLRRTSQKVGVKERPLPTNDTLLQGSGNCLVLASSHVTLRRVCTDFSGELFLFLFWKDTQSQMAGPCEVTARRTSPGFRKQHCAECRKTVFKITECIQSPTLPLGGCAVLEGFLHLAFVFSLVKQGLIAMPTSSITVPTGDNTHQVFRAAPGAEQALSECRLLSLHSPLSLQAPHPSPSPPSCIRTMAKAIMGNNALGNLTKSHRQPDHQLGYK
jgi:hypothetical protein